MKIETFDREDHQKLVTAEADMETLEQFKHQAARKISAEAKIAGFRPGKAPFEVVRRIYGEKVIHDEAITLMLDQIYPQAIKEAGINPGGPGQLQEVSNDEPPKFTFLVPLAPEVTLGDYRAIRSEYTPPVVGDEQVDEVIRRLQRQTAISTPLEKPAVEGNMLEVKIVGRLQVEVEGEDNVLVPESSRQMIAGDARDYTDADGNEWPFPGFAAKLVGVSAGDKLIFNYSFPDDGSSDDLTGKDAVFTVDVNRVNELELHPLDDEFAQSLGSYETIEKLRESIQKDLQTEQSNKYNREYVDAIIDQMVSEAAVKFSPTALDDEVEHVITHFEERLKRDQLDFETYLKTLDLTREQFIEKETKPVAERNLKRNLVLEQFSIAENIQVSQEEAQMILNMAQSQALQDPSIKSLAKGGVTKKQVAENLARSTINEIFNQRMMNRLRDIATGKADEPVEMPPAELITGVPLEAPSAELDADAPAETPMAELEAVAPAEGLAEETAETPAEVPALTENQAEDNTQATAE